MLARNALKSENSCSHDENVRILRFERYNSKSYVVCTDAELSITAPYFCLFVGLV